MDRWLVTLISDLSFVLQVSFSILLEVLGTEWNVRPKKSCLDCGARDENQLLLPYFCLLKYS